MGSTMGQPQQMEMAGGVRPAGSGGLCGAQRGRAVLLPCPIRAAAGGRGHSPCPLLKRASVTEMVQKVPVGMPRVALCFAPFL